MAPFGYTPQRAEEAKNKVDLFLSQAEDRVRCIAGVVPGAGAIGARGEDIIEEMRAFASDLQQLVDDRTDVAAAGCSGGGQRGQRVA